MGINYSLRAANDVFTTRERMGIDEVAESFLNWLVQEEYERQEKIKNYREYYEGEHDTMLTERQKEYLQVKTHTEFNANYCPLVVNELARRLRVRGFDAGEQGGESGMLWEWWKLNRMDAVQHDVHVAQIRDGDSYVIVSWDNELGVPRFHHNLAFDGDEGTQVYYDDETNTVTYAVKKWVSRRPPDAGFVRRMNVYEPDRVLRFISDDRVSDGAWRPYNGDGQEAELPWVNRRNEPLGVPVVHFAHNRAGYRWGMSALEPVVPLQNALNKAIIDMIAAADTTGFRIFTMLGGEPVDENGDPIKISPGSFISMMNPPSEGAIGFIPGEDLRPLIEVVDAFKISIAQVTETPLHLFQVSGQNASEGSQKQQEVGMISKAEDASVQTGNAWEDVLAMARKLYNAFGDGGMDETQIISTLWHDFEVRNKEERALARSEIFKNLVDAGVDGETAALEAGYSEERAKQMGRKMRLLARDQINPPTIQRSMSANGTVPTPERTPENAG